MTKLKWRYEPHDHVNRLGEEVTHRHKGHGWHPHVIRGETYDGWRPAGVSRWITQEVWKDELLRMVEDAEALSREIPPEEIEEIKRLGKENPLPPDQARRLMTRIGVIIGLDDPEGWANRLVEEREKETEDG